VYTLAANKLSATGLWGEAKDCYAGAFQDDLRKQLAARETHQKRCPRAGPLRCNRPREEVVEVEVFPSLPRLQLPFSE
jgi:hypothetical protein